jgi:prepilin-type N-terminal cleavage/methylation domain-containing protein
MRTTSSGFTLIEFLITAAILSILITAVVIAINPKARINEALDSQRRTDLAQMRSALEAYATAHNASYPSTEGLWLCFGCSAYGTDSLGNSTTAESWIPQLSQTGFLKSLPRDPKTGMASDLCGSGLNGIAGYSYMSDGKNFKLRATCTPASGLHSASDGDFCASLGSIPTATSTGGASLKPLVDPYRPSVGYAVYSIPTNSLDSHPGCW